MAQDDIVIVSAARTPVGAFNGAFGNTPAHELGKVAITAAMERAKVDPGEVDELIFGQVPPPTPARTRPGRPPWRPASRPRRPPGR